MGKLIAVDQFVITITPPTITGTPPTIMPPPSTIVKAGGLGVYSGVLTISYATMTDPSLGVAPLVSFTLAPTATKVMVGKMPVVLQGDKATATAAFTLPGTPPVTTTIPVTIEVSVAGQTKVFGA